MTIRVGINGFGRIGRNLFRAAKASGAPIDFVAVNDLGDVPTMARWLRDGSHRLIRWETDWSSQTGASQAGLLHGRNDEIPAFRWWDKELGAPVASSAPRDVMAIEARTEA